MIADIKNYKAVYIKHNPILDRKPGNLKFNIFLCVSFFIEHEALKNEFK